MNSVRCRSGSERTPHNDEGIWPTLTQSHDWRKPIDKVAEGVGVEPTVRLPLRLISSQVP